MVAAAYAAIRILLPDHMGIYAAILSGLAAGVLIGAVTEYYTSDTYNPTRKLAASSRTGGATVIISGLSLGMLSTVAPVVIVGVSVLISYYCSGGSADFNAGLYGVGVSAVGMLSTLGITLATDAYGPVADNAGRYCRDDAHAGGGASENRCTGFPGQHHGCHRQGICHWFRRAYGPGPDSVLY